MQILAEILVQLFQHWVLRRFPALFDVFFGLSAAAGMTAGVAAFQADSAIAGTLLLAGGLVALGVAILSYRQRRQTEGSDG